MTSTVTNIPVTTNTISDRSIKRKKKKSTMMIKETHQQQQSHTKWKSETQQRIYSTKFLQALSQVSLSNNNNNNGHSSSASRGGLAVREAADKALAVAAKGRSRWSRAILTSRLRLKFRKQKRTRGSVAGVTGSNRLMKKSRFVVSKLTAKSLPAVQRKVKVLGRLVPGCRKEPLPVILEEATDYIAALEMQIRAMSTLAELLSGSSSAPPPTPPPSSP